MTRRPYRVTKSEVLAYLECITRESRAARNRRDAERARGHNDQASYEGGIADGLESAAHLLRATLLIDDTRSLPSLLVDDDFK